MRSILTTRKTRRRRAEIDDLATRAETLVAAGRGREAIAVLAAADREAPDAELESLLVRIRNEAFATETHGPGLAAWPPASPDLFGAVDGMPEVGRADLSGALLRSGIVRHEIGRAHV